MWMYGIWHTKTPRSALIDVICVFDLRLYNTRIYNSHACLYHQQKIPMHWNICLYHTDMNRLNGMTLVSVVKVDIRHARGRLQYRLSESHIKLKSCEQNVVRNIYFSCQIILKICTEHGIDAVKRNFTQFAFKMCFGLQQPLASVGYQNMFSSIISAFMRIIKT